jgi:hypothetical protein
LYYKNIFKDMPIKLRFGPEKGRSLYAAKDFQVGETIFRESPITGFISPFNVWGPHCANCGQTLEEPQYRQELETDLPKVKTPRNFLRNF